MYSNDVSRPQMVDEYLKFCKIHLNAIKSGIIDLSECDWFYPTSLLPLWITKNSDKYEYIPPSNPDVAHYISTVTESAYSEKSSYMPLQFFPKSRVKPTELDSRITRLCNGRDCNERDFGGKDAFMFLLDEMINNVYQHSEFNHAGVLAQRYAHKNFVEISFFDDGISIPGSFEKHDIPFKTDEDAIARAINGTSTKERHDEERGFGLNTTTKMYTKGGNGEVLLISRNGILYKNKEEREKLYSLKGSYKLRGTLLSVRLPYPAAKINVEIYS